jgi:hypothetical protein
VSRSAAASAPADGAAAAFGSEDAALLERPGQHDGAGDRQAEPEDEPGADAPAEAPGEPHAERGQDRHLRERARQRDGPDRQQVARREVQAHREQQEDHADVGEFGGERGVGDEAGGEGADRDPGQQVAHERRDPRAVRRHAEGEGEGDADDHGRDQRRVVHHRPPSGGGAPAPRRAPQACAHRRRPRVRSGAAAAHHGTLAW